MAYITNFDASNKADFIVDFSATDAETGDDIDFTGASVDIRVRDENNCQRLEASIGSGITQPSSTVIELWFTADQMESLCAGTYSIGGVYSLNGQTIQLFTGTMTVYNGIAQL